MVHSPIPFTESFMTKVKNEILKQNLAEEVVREKELSRQLEEDYRAWSEKKLKGCPQFMRKFSSTISCVAPSYWGSRNECCRFETQQKVCMVPGYVENPSDPKVIELHSDHPLFSRFIELKRLRDKLNVNVYTKKLPDDSTTKAKCFKTFTLYSTEGDDKLISDMVAEYIETTKKQLNDFILGVQEPEEDDTKDWVQLELF